MSSPKISIIVPVYNVENYLCKCVDSILEQTYKEIELILIDDGSTDSSGVICDKYKNKDTRVFVIHKKNEGVSSARNCGLKVAVGDYVGFVDSDDYVLNDMYEYLLNLSIMYNADITSCSFSVINDKGIIIHRIKKRRIMRVKIRGYRF